MMDSEEPRLFTPLLMAKLSFLKFLNSPHNCGYKICSVTEGNKEERQIQRHRTQEVVQNVNA